MIFANDEKSLVSNRRRFDLQLGEVLAKMQSISARPTESRARPVPFFL